MTFETPISVHDEAKPLGAHLYSLVGPSPDRQSFRWTAFDFGGQPDAGVAVDKWSDSVLGRIDYQDRAAVYKIAATLKPGTTMVITDYSASPQTRTGPDFTVIAEDMAVPGKRKI